jgi:hypothetical protein
MQMIDDDPTIETTELDDETLEMVTGGQEETIYNPPPPTEGASA